MKFTIDRSLLFEHLTNAIKVISPRNTMPVLSGIKLEISNSQLIIVGSDSDMSIELTIPTQNEEEQIIEVTTPGAIVLPGKFFVDIIRKLPGDDVTIESKENNHAIIKSKSAEFNVTGVDPDQYPLLPEVSKEESIELPISLLKKIINQTSFAVSSSETRPILTGVLFETSGNTLKFTATDSHRLAYREVTIEQSLPELKHVIPGKAFVELSKVIDEHDDPIQISFANNQVLFEYNELKFISRLLEGNYPDTSRLFPDQYETKIDVNKDLLLKSTERASLLAKEAGNHVTKISVKDQIVEISANSPEVGETKETVDVNSIDGEEIKLNFNSKYMMDALKSVDDDHVVIEFSGTMKPFIIKPQSTDDLKQLILPIRSY